MRLTGNVAVSCGDEPSVDTRWRLNLVSVRTLCPFGLNVQTGRYGHRDGTHRGSDAAASLTAFEKALERNDFGRRVDRHCRSSSGGLDEALKRQARKIPREGRRNSGKQTS